MTRAVCDQALAGRADARALRMATGPRWWADTATQERIEAAIERLHGGGAAWAALAPGESLRLTWHADAGKRARASGVTRSQRT